jgi:hypothetical protein
MICQHLASSGGQLAGVLGELSPTAVEQYFDSMQALSTGDATV